MEEAHKQHLAKSGNAAELVADPFLASFNEEESDDLSHSDKCNDTVARIERVATPASTPLPGGRDRQPPPGSGGGGAKGLSSLKMRMSLRASTGA